VRVNLAEVLRSGARVGAMLNGERHTDGVDHRENRWDLLFMREREGGQGGQVRCETRRSVAVC
jgi:hypothetical protein